MDVTPRDVPEAEVRGRIRRLQELLRAGGMDAALYLQNVDRYYLSGSMQDGCVVVPAEGEAVALVRRDPDRAARESPLRVEPLPGLRALPGLVERVVGGTPRRIGMELDVLPVAQYRRLAALFPGAEVVDGSAPLIRVRCVKSPWEIERIRAAARVVAEAVDMLPGLLRPGITEIELSARMEQELRVRGHGGLIRMRGFNQEIFFGHVMAGESAAEPSFLDAPTGGRGLGPALAQGPSFREIRPGEPVVVDLVGNHQGYLSDQTRMFCLGPPGPRLREAFEAALGIADTVVAAARPGVPAGRLYEIALEEASRTPFGDAFLGSGRKVSFVGHGIGLEVDEPPFLARGVKMPLEEGMVFALEPKFVIPGFGAVGIEDTYRVAAVGLERLTPSPRELRTA